MFFSFLADQLMLRALGAFVTALVLGLALGPWMINRLKAMAFGQAVRDCGPKTHLAKQGTPTMGGALILFAIAVGTLLWADWSDRFIWPVLVVTLGYGAVGWVDDYRKVVFKNPKGMSAREKFSWQSGIALVVGAYLAVALATPDGSSMTTTLAQWWDAGLPLSMGTSDVFYLPFGWVGFLVFTYFVLVGSSNAVNLTDGLDGLAIVPTVVAGCALGAFCYVVGTPHAASLFNDVYLPGAAELVIVSAALLGAGLAFLWFNAHPAQVFMGDVGALALGGLLGAMAVVCRHEWLFAMMAGVFVVETVSVMIQTVYYRLSGGKRVFLMAPIHHHFELKGWKETQVVARFWIVSILLAIMGLAGLYLESFL